MVEAATLMPKAASSPWILRYPYEGFSPARRRTRARIERTVGGCPRRFGPIRKPVGLWEPPIRWRNALRLLRPTHASTPLFRTP